jgi:ribonucleotide reductase alpha subunit
MNPQPISLSILRQKYANPVKAASFGAFPRNCRTRYGHTACATVIFCLSPRPGTISLAFADNVSNGIEPAYAWTYRRSVRPADGRTRDYHIEDHAYRLYRMRIGAEAELPLPFVSALELGMNAHMAMVAAVTPYIDSSISKTVNVTGGYPFSEFENLYLKAWKLGLKALATFRPNKIRKAVLSAEKNSSHPAKGIHCPRCGNPDLRRIDGCNYCNRCGFDSECG